MSLDEIDWEAEARLERHQHIMMKIAAPAPKMAPRSRALETGFEAPLAPPLEAYLKKRTKAELIEIIRQLQTRYLGRRAAFDDSVIWRAAVVCAEREVDEADRAYVAAEGERLFDADGQARWERLERAWEKSRAAYTRAQDWWRK